MKQLYFVLYVIACSLLPNARIWGQGTSTCSTRPAGADRYVAINAGLLTACAPSFTDTKNNSAANCFGNFFESSQGGQPSDEIFYRFTLASPQKVVISHCGSGFDTYVSLLDGSGNVLAQADDTTKTGTSCSSGIYSEAYLTRSLPAGTYYVVSEAWSTLSGNIVTTITASGGRPQGATLANAIDAGSLSSCGASFADMQRLDATTCFGDDYTTAQPEGRPTDDIYYKFTLTSSAEVTLAHCNTGLAFRGRDPDTYIHLLDANGNHLVSNDDYGPACYSGRSSLRQTLAAGTYYVVSELYNNDSYCDLITTITTTTPPAVAVTAPTTTLAVGGSTTLTASGANSYTWAPAIGLSATTGTSVTAAPTRTTTYTVSGTGSGACNTATASITVIVSSVPTAPSDPAQDLDRNWTFSRTYDLDGNITGESKQFSDAMGRPTQSQVKNIAAKQVFASQVVNNTGGVAVLSTLPAPTYNQEFKYRSDFMTAGGTAYSASQFEGSNVSRPVAPDSTTQGTLGYYYSTNNTWEPTNAATRNPFSLREPSSGPLGGLRRAAGPGDKFRMGAGHETRGRDFPLLNELTYYSSLRPQFVSGSATPSLRAQGVKVVSVNTSGVESIAFANREGQPLASCLSGDQYPALTLTGAINSDATNAAGSPVYQDLHVAASATTTPVTMTDAVGGGTFVLVDLVSAVETTYSGSRTLNLAPGFYRLLATSGQFSFSYAVHYGNFSFTYYDDAGRVVATVAPNGLQGRNLLRNPGFEQDPNGGMSGWTNSTSSGTYTQAQFGPNNFPPAHGGQLYGVHWAPAGHNVYTYQTITGLTNGLYTAKAWVKNTGISQNYPQQTASLLAKEYNSNNSQRGADIPVTYSWGEWVQVQVTDIPVVNGQCTIGLYSISQKDDWITFDDVEFFRQTPETTPNFVTRNVYDAAGRLLQITSPDEGQNQYVYARDGRLRFSQSARQAAEGKFSYSNYDTAGRVVESGEYQMANDRTQGLVFESPLNLPTRLYEAEDASATIVGASRDTNWPGYSGSGFIGNITQQNTSRVQLALNNVPATGYYAVEIRYAAAFSDTRTLSVYCNGQLSQQASFPSTGSWTTWSTQTLLMPLQAGGNTVEFRYGATDSGWINIDYLRLILPTTTTTNSILADAVLEDRTRTGSLEVSRCSQRNQVWYDVPFSDSQLGGRNQEFLLGGVAKTTKDGATTWYSYNDLGQLAWMVQEQPVVGIKMLEYTYNAVGNVLTIAYQKNQADAFYHYYSYDANQRLTQAFTSPDGTTKTLRASYSYYLHGPLKRVELAGNLQGLDYTYTVQGWLKTINNAQRGLDPGVDGPNASGMFKDLFGMRLDYFDNDYRSQQVASLNPSVSLNQTRQRYDGTVRATAWRTEASAQTYGMGYLYDPKGQLLEANFATVTNGTTFAFNATRTNGEDNLSYDANGNLGSLRRTSSTGTVSDNFTYQYAPGTNKLAAVNNPAGTTVLDYDYDATGQMTRQRDEQGQRYLRYDVSGKVTGIFRDPTRRQPLVIFTYDDRGFRASKASYNAAGILLRTIYSVRDMQGNEVSTYTQEGLGNVVRSEVPLYGANRLGTLIRLDDGNMDSRYELNDHLGTARVVFHKPTTETNTETMELSGVPAKAAFQGADMYRAAPSSGGHSGSTYAAQLDGRASIKPVLKRILTVQQGDTITFTAWAKAPGGFRPAAGTSTGVRPLLLLGTASLGTNNALRLPEGTPLVPSTRSANWLSRLSIGLSIPLLQKATTPAIGAQSRSPQLAQRINYDAWIQYRVLDAQGNQVGAIQKDFVPNDNQGAWLPLKVAVRVQQGGTVELLATSTDNNTLIILDDLMVEQTGGMIVQEQHTYAYGAPLPGLNYVIGNKKYRHGYQGQFAERNEETGTDDFELRLYDSRIGRWTAPDPAGQFHSPYVGMGNNPVSNVDPDGAWIPIFNGAEQWGLLHYLGTGLKGSASIALHAAPSFGAGAAINAMKVFIGPSQTAINGHLFDNENQAYKHMLDLQKSESKEMGAVLVEGRNGKKGVYVFAYGKNTYSSQTNYTDRDDPGTTLILKTKIMSVKGVAYKVLAHVHTHPYADADGYEGPSGVTNGTVNSAQGKDHNDMVAYSSWGGTTPFFVIGPSQVSRLDPSKPYFKSPDKKTYNNTGNQHQIMTTTELLGGKSLFNYLK